MTSRHVLLVGHDAGGTVPPMLALAQELVGRGHAVTWLSQPSVRERATVAGCRFTPFDGIGDYDARRPIEEQIDLAMPVIAGNEIGDQLLGIVSADHVDAVVVDCNLSGAGAAAESLDLPSAVLLHSMYKTFTDVWFGELWPFMATAINARRESYGLAPTGTWADVHAGHDRLVSVVPASFEAPVDSVPDTMRHFGFLVPVPTATEMAAGVVGDGREPTVLVSLSTTYQHQDDLLARIVAALADRPVRGVVTTAGQVDPADLAAPANVAIYDYLEHSLVLPHTDVLITHAGLGTVAAGLSHGVPIVGVPLGRDQALNAGRVADLGAGIALPPDASSRRITKALDEVLTDASYTDAARAIASASAEAGGAAAAIDDLESLIA
jgi:MGT family glycosyltransferase